MKDYAHVVGYTVVGDEENLSFVDAKRKAEQMSNAAGKIFKVCRLTVEAYSVPDSQATTSEEAIAVVRGHLAKQEVPA